MPDPTTPTNTTTPEQILSQSDLFCIIQWGDIKHRGTRGDCERIAKRWTEQHGNVELKVIPLQNK